jgi:gamma-glutamyltranspeptidase
LEWTRKQQLIDQVIPFFNLGLHDQLQSKTNYEEFIDKFITDGLKNVGYNVTELKGIADGQNGIGNVQVCLNKDSNFIGASDKRKFGSSCVY